MEPGEQVGGEGQVTVKGLLQGSREWLDLKRPGTGTCGEV